MVITDAPLETHGTGVLQARIHSSDEVVSAIGTLTDHKDVKEAHLWSPSVENVWEEFKALYKFVLAAGGVVTDEKGRLLVIKRLGKWDLPKGKVESEEAIEAAAMREVQEECGLDQLKIIRDMPSTWHTYEQKGKMHLKRTDWFLMRGNSEEKLVAQTNENIEEVRWMDAAEVATMKIATYPSLVAVLEAWERRNT